METTSEQRAAVRRDECRLHGHSFTEVVALGCLAPQRVRCDNCGSVWRIHPEDVRADFGAERVAHP